MLYYDPTEARDNTLLPANVLRAGTPLPGLEAATGADLLLSPWSEPILDRVTESLPSRKALEKHCREAGALLVQRKSGTDLVGSLADLDHIEMRMREWTDRPWLVTVGLITSTVEGECVIDGRATGYSWAAVDGAINWWQLRGGGYSNLPGPRAFAAWTNNWLARLETLLSEPVKRARLPAQTLVPGGWPDALVHARIGLGEERSKALAEFCGSLAFALQYLSDPHSLEVHRLPGIGPATIAKARDWLGLKDGLVLVVSGVPEDDEMEVDHGTNES